MDTADSQNHHHHGEEEDFRDETEEEEDAIIIDNLNYLSFHTTIFHTIYNYKTACARMIDDSNELKLRAVQH